MPICDNRVRLVGTRSGKRRLRRQRARRSSTAASQLDSSIRLIAPPHSLTIPSLQGVRNRVEVSYGFENALPPAEVLIKKGILLRRHFDGCRSVPEVVAKAIQDVIQPSVGSGADAFSIEIRLADRLDQGPSRGDCLFFTWGNTDAPAQYIPLRPMYEHLDGNSYRERLLASLYHWLYEAACEVCCGFGFREAESLYSWEKEMYAEARESGEDVDLEGEVESANPATVVSYIRDSTRLKLRTNEIDRAISSIPRPELRDAFEKARRAFVLSRKIHLPDISRDCQGIIDDAAYYMDGEPIPGLCISHWRNDAVVAWLDNFCEAQFNSGVTCRPPIIRCFPPDDTRSFQQIISALPIMVETVSALSEWVRIAGEMENEFNCRDRGSARVHTCQGDSHL